MSVGGAPTGGSRCGSARSSALLLTPRELLSFGTVYAPRAIVGRTARARLFRLRAPFPACFSYGCFEVHLGEKRRVDFLAGSTRLDGACEMLRRDASARRSTKGSPSPEGRLLAVWAAARKPAASHIRDIWLEWDVSGASPSRPFAFVRLVDGAGPAGAIGIVDLLRDLQGWPARKGLGPLESVHRIWRGLGKVLHIALMPSRGTSDIRVQLGSQPGELIRGLAAIGWPGDLKVAADLTRLWLGESGLTGVQLQIGDTLRPDLDIEYCRDTPTGYDTRTQAFVEKLCRRGLLRPDHACAFEKWTAADDSRRHADHLNVQVIRRLQLKLCLRGGRPPFAKAYLGFTPRYYAD